MLVRKRTKLPPRAKRMPGLKLCRSIATGSARVNALHWSTHTSSPGAPDSSSALGVVETGGGPENWSLEPEGAAAVESVPDLADGDAFLGSLDPESGGASDGVPAPCEPSLGEPPPPPGELSAGGVEGGVSTGVPGSCGGGGSTGWTGGDTGLPGSPALGGGVPGSDGPPGWPVPPSAGPGGAGGGVLGASVLGPAEGDRSSARAVDAHEASSTRTSHTAVSVTAGASRLLQAGAIRTAVALGAVNSGQVRETDTC